MSSDDFFGPIGITKDRFLKIRNDEAPHRICFQTIHKNALTEYSGRFEYKFRVPFWQSVGPLFEEQTGFELHRSRYEGYWVGLADKSGRDVVETWMRNQGSRVFLRDCLDHSYALSHHMDEANTARSYVGELEHRAKNERCRKSAGELADRLVKMLDELSIVKKVRVLTVPPPRKGKDFDLPSELANDVSRRMGIDFIPAGEWVGEKGQLKSALIDEKWDQLEAANFRLNPDIAGKSVWIIDDLYQSGTTINFIGGKLRSGGSDFTGGICIVKSSLDTDNK